MTMQEKGRPMSRFQQEVVARAQKEFADTAFICSTLQRLSFATFRLDQIPSAYFAYLPKAFALEQATLGPTTLIAFPDKIKLHPDKGSTPTFEFSERAYRVPEIDINDPRVQIRQPTFFEAVYLDRAYLNEKRHVLFDNFAVRTASFLVERNHHNSRGGYELVEDPERIRLMLEANGQHPLLNVMVGRPYQSRGLIVDVVLPRAAYPYLYCPPVMVLRGE